MANESRDLAKMNLQELEAEKLREEIREIRARMMSTHSAHLLEKFKVYPTYLAIAVSLILGTVNYFNQRQQHLDQLELQQRMKLSEQMITLVGQLDAKSPELQRLAALKLATLGAPAIPLLVENLDMKHQEIVYHTIATALCDMLKDEKNHEVIVSRLLDSARTVISREIREDNPDSYIIEGHVKALGRIAAALPRKRQVRRYQQMRNEINRTLGQWQSLLANHSGMSHEDKHRLQGAMEAAKSK